MAIKVGDQAPDFKLKSAQGETIQLSELLKGKPVVLFFYPKDNTPGCTKEACAFRDQYEVFQEVGAEVVGISADSEQSHQQFASAYQLPFLLLSDSQNRVRKSFGVPSTLGILPGRVTYIINQQGTVCHLFNSQLNFQGHVDEALKALQAIPSA
ncbi:redoxin domain-containing protein [Synechococcales cyanobacterium C]|uniref:thioredoxin-dependent peroxiredoxin n=1 Tax=Petrachloros mirabilis ULC683 TaxID=2781853 RepID=A0A8K2A852_9CYAN|nr:peroxiredoxin [Petrachloros mirabilis]NCJ06760.1 redoxin domain-containing protein [Petrachloros mirabilis ULC683]